MDITQPGYPQPTPAEDYPEATTAQRQKPPCEPISPADNYPEATTAQPQKPPCQPIQEFPAEPETQGPKKSVNKKQLCCCLRICC
ncbi:protein piccolo-like [Dendropsophus ebraccatus]|uniref:protein piccolo-like n=1 Tax=Dendropsophus ebraccatus TaxID=150705 RepID=UPI0038321C3C